MSEATPTAVDEVQDPFQDDEGQAILDQLQQLFSGPQQDEALFTRLTSHAEEVNDYLTRVDEAENGTINPDGYNVHFSDQQAAWVLCAVGTFIQRAVPDNQDGAGDHLVDAAEAILAAVRS